MRFIILILFLFISFNPVLAESLGGDQARRSAERMNTAAKSILAPVYPALAEWIVARYELKKRDGIGIDLGGGPGDLVVELGARAESMFWINADINPFSFPFMYKAAVKAGVGHRVGAVFADAHAMPFKDDYADIVVSRGTFQFWHDKPAAFREIHRILKPGGTALIGRGYSGNLPPAVAVSIRQAHGDGGPSYDIEETAVELRELMNLLEIEDYTIIIPKHEEQPGLKYGIWLEFRKQQ